MHFQAEDQRISSFNKMTKHHKLSVDREDPFQHNRGRIKRDSVLRGSVEMAPLSFSKI